MIAWLTRTLATEASAQQHEHLPRGLIILPVASVLVVGRWVERRDDSSRSIPERSPTLDMDSYGRYPVLHSCSVQFAWRLLVISFPLFVGLVKKDLGPPYC
jgi:hypothetical protein